jgi:hypothetical protein
MIAIESPAFTWKAVKEKSAIRKSKKNERLAKGLFLQKFFFIRNGFVVMSA